MSRERVREIVDAALDQRRQEAQRRATPEWARALDRGERLSIDPLEREPFDDQCRSRRPEA
jgi:hypothetical protein